MKTTVTPVLKKKNKKDKFGIINIRITKDRKSEYISTGIKLAERFWNINGKSVDGKLRNHRDFDEDQRNDIVNTVKSKIEVIEKENLITTNSDIPILNSNQSFLSYLKQHILFLEKRKQIGTSKRYKTTFYQIEKFLKPSNKSDLLFSEITSDFVESFETFLIESGLLVNTTKNYINCIKRLYVKVINTGKYNTSLDPFVNFKNRRTSVKKGFLEKKEVDKIRGLKLDEDNPLYHIRNYFLFQIFGQGLRISDLLTLRWGNIIEGEIVFFQYKTKKEHTIYLTEMVMFLLKNYINDKTFEKIFTQRWIYKFKGEQCKGNYNELQSRFTELTNLYVATALERTEERKQMYADLEYFRFKILSSVRDKVSIQMSTALQTYAKNHSNDFIFPLVNPQLFTDVAFDGDTTLSKPQYNHLHGRFGDMLHPIPWQN